MTGLTTTFQDGHILHGTDLDAAFAKTVEVGTVGDETVTSTGASVARRLAARFSDVWSIEDFGVVHDPSGAHVAANTAAYQAALTAAAGVARLRHRAGLTVYANALTVPSGAALELDGAVYVASTSAGQAFIVGSNWSIVSSTKKGIIDCNNLPSAQYGNCGVWSPNDYAGGSPATGNPAQSNGYLFGVEIRNATHWPVSIAHTSNCIVEHCYLHDSTNAPQFVGACTNCIAQFNRIENIQDYAFAIYQGGKYCEIRYNYAYNAGPFGILTDGGTVAVNSSSSCSIKNNTNVGDAGSQGILIHNTIGATFQDIAIIGNRLINCNTTYTGQPFVLQVDYTNGLTIHDNTIIGGGPNVGSATAIIWSNCNHVSVKRNSIIDFGTVDNAIAIGSETNGEYVTIQDNAAFDTRATPYLKSGVHIAAGLQMTIKDNDMNSLTYPYYITGEADDLIFDQQGALGVVRNGWQTFTKPRVSSAIDLLSADQIVSGGNATIPLPTQETIVVVSGPTHSSLSSWAVTLPEPPTTDGISDFHIYSDIPISGITWTAPTGKFLKGATLPTSMAAGDYVMLKWFAGFNSWLHVAPK